MLQCLTTTAGATKKAKEGEESTSGFVWRREVFFRHWFLEDAELTHDEVVDFDLAQAGLPDLEPADSEGADRERADRQRAEGEGT